jgi:hypothetical protein
LTRPRDPVVFFVDRSLGAVEVPEALRRAGASVEIHDHHFAQDTPDSDWLAAVGTHGWVVLTRDERIRRHPGELDALMTAGIAAFVLTASGVTGAEMGTILTHALPAMTRLAHSLSRPFVGTISRGGAINIKIGGGRRGGVRRDARH